MIGIRYGHHHTIHATQYPQNKLTQKKTTTILISVLSINHKEWPAFCQSGSSRHFPTLLNSACVQERDTACCLREDQAGCVQTQKSECKGAEGHNPPRTETVQIAGRAASGHHKWVSPHVRWQMEVKVLLHLNIEARSWPW